MLTIARQAPITPLPGLHGRVGKCPKTQWQRTKQGRLLVVGLTLVSAGRFFGKASRGETRPHSGPCAAQGNPWTEDAGCGLGLPSAAWASSQDGGPKRPGSGEEAVSLLVAKWQESLRVTCAWEELRFTQPRLWEEASRWVPSLNLVL